VIQKINKKFKIKDLFIEYVKQRSLWVVLGTTFFNGMDQVSLELTRLAAQNSYQKRLYKRYSCVLDREITPLVAKKNGVKDDVVWFLWFQGIEEAPELVKKCYQSMRKQLSNHNIINITRENYKEYIDLPRYVLKRLDNGEINPTKFSDILRIELLATYGGTWIDATVFISQSELPESWLQSDIFFFQNLKPGKNGDPLALSSWFIHAKKGNLLVRWTRELFNEYLKDNNGSEDYFWPHHLLTIARKRYETTRNIPKYSNSVPHVFLLEWGDNYQHQRFKEMMEMSPIHKLSYKQIPKGKDTFYQYWFEKNESYEE
jgi:hypothetical protein